MYPRPIFAIAATLVLGCGASTDPGVYVDLRSEPPFREVTGPIFNDHGQHVTLLGGYVAIGSVELKACPTAGLPKLLDWLSPIREAHAHVASSPTLLGDPFVEALVDERGATALGRLAPPPGAYCSVKVLIHPADLDAAGLPEQVDMVGKSLVLFGTCGEPNQPPAAFHLSTSESLTIEIPLDGFTLGPESPHPTMTFVKKAVDWFDGVDFMAQPEGVQAFKALENVGASLSVRVE